MRILSIAASALWFALPDPVVAQAEDVKLTSRDGSIQLEGSLLGFDGEFFRVDTKYGLLTVDAQGVVCEGVGCPNLEAYIAEINLSGTRLMGDLLVPALLQAFADRNGYSVLREVVDDTHSTFVMRDNDRDLARFGLRSTTTSEGFADLIAEAADIAMVLREPDTRELEMARSAGVGNLLENRRGRVVALDGIAALKSSTQPTRAVGLEELAGIFSGEVENWSEIGGPDVPIKLVLPGELNGLVRVLEDSIMAQYGKSLGEPQASFASLEELSDSVSLDISSIALSTLSQVGNADILSIKGSCGFEQRPNLASLRNEDYPLILPLMFFTPARRLPLIGREFIDFVASTASDTVIRRAGFVDQSVRSSNFRNQGDRLALAIQMAGRDVTLAELQRLVSVLGQLDRLSTTFRFRDGSSELDAKSRENVLRLARAMELGVFDDHELLFVGFSDSEGASGPNLQLAKRRAEEVLALVKDAAADATLSRLEMKVEAFGEALPMACDDTAWGRAANRRVEVWLK